MASRKYTRRRGGGKGKKANRSTVKKPVRAKSTIKKGKSLYKRRSTRMSKRSKRSNRNKKIRGGQPIVGVPPIGGEPESYRDNFDGIIDSKEEEEELMEMATEDEKENMKKREAFLFREWENDDAEILYQKNILEDAKRKANFGAAGVMKDLEIDRKINKREAKRLNAKIAEDYNKSLAQYGKIKSEILDFRNRREQQGTTTEHREIIEFKKRLAAKKDGIERPDQKLPKFIEPGGPPTLGD